MPVITQTVFNAADYPDLLGTTAREGGSWLVKALSAPPGPARTRRIVDRCRGVAARLPITDGAPPAVLAAHKQFIARVDEAEAAADALEAAQAAVDESLRTDVATAGALKRGTALVHSALTRPKARANAEIAETMALAAEGAALAALQSLLEVTRDEWQAWRVALAREAAIASDEAVVVFAAASSAIAKRGAALERINALDWEIASRFTDEWTASGRTIDYDGAGRVVIDQPHPKAAHTFFALTAEVEALRAGLSVAYDWAPAATPPPPEPEMVVEYGGAGDIVGVKVRA